MNLLKQNLIDQDSNVSFKLIHEENRLLQKKIKDLEGQITQQAQQIAQNNATIANNMKVLNNADQKAKQFDFWQKTSENLTRRLRFHRDYNLKQINAITSNEDIANAPFFCVCGGEQLATEQPVNHTNHQPVQAPVLHTNNNVNEKNSTTEELQMSNSSEKSILKEKIQLETENHELKVQLKNSEELIFKSKVFAKLVNQSTDIYQKYNEMREAMKTTHQKILEIEVLRKKELEDNNVYWDKKVNQLLKQIEDLSSKSKNDPSNNSQNLFQNQQHTKELIQSLENQIKNHAAIGKENQNLLSIVKQLEAELNQVKRSNQELKEKQFNFDLHKYFSQTHQEIFQINYKQGKYKEVALEIDKLIRTHEPALKQRFEELIIFVKSREQKNEHYEQKLQKVESELENQQKFVEELLQEIELTTNNYQIIQDQKQKLLQQIQDSEQTLNKIVIEKYNEKSHFDTQIQLLNQKLESDAALLSQQQEMEKQLTQQLGLIQQDYTIKNKTLDGKQQLISDYEKKLSELQQSNEEIRQEQALNHSKNNDYFKINQSYIESAQKKELHIQNLKKDLNELMNTQKQGQPNIYQLQLRNLKKMLQCTNCESRDKNHILKSCNHMFCKECIDKNVALRTRACFICKAKFTQDDVQKVYFV